MTPQNTGTKVLALAAILLFSLFPSLMSGQAATGINNLFFNSNNNITAMSFASTPPGLTYTGIGNGFEGIAHGEDGSGNVLFFVNATGVYRYPSGTLMPGSVGILANTSSAEMAVCPVPGNPDQHYIFYNAQTCSPMYYAIVDMSLAGGAGDILGGTLNTQISSQNYAEGMEVIRKTSPCDTIPEFWLVGYECNVGFTRWLIDTAGVGSQTTILNWNPGGGYDGRGELDYHFGRLGLACTYTVPSFLGDFNPATGTLTFNAQINTPGTSFQAGAYGVEFSPDGTKAYFTDWYNSTGSDNLFIYDYNTGIQTDTVIPTSGQGFGEIEMGKDGKLYIIMYQTNLITVLQNPNDPPNLLTWANTTLTSTVNMGLGISDHIQSDFLPLPYIPDEAYCISGPTPIFTPQPLDSVRWLDSNGVIVGSGVPFTAPAQPMIYTVTGLDTCLGAPVSYQVAIGYVDSTITVSKDSLCLGDSTVMSAGIAQVYSWSPATGLSCTNCQTVTATPSVTTTYYLTLEDTSIGCQKVDSVTIFVGAPPTAIIDPVANQCFDGHTFNFTQSGTYAGTSQFSWIFPGGTPGASGAEFPSGITYPSPGPKSAILQINNQGCISNIDTVTFEVFVEPDASITNSADTICSGDAVNLSTGSGGTIVWSPGFGLSCTNCQSPVASPPVTTVYEAEITTSNGCVDVDSVEIFVHPLPTASINVVQNQCLLGNSFDFSQNGIYGAGANFFWTFPSGTPGTSNLENPTGITYSNPGPKIAILQVVENGCFSNIDTINFEVYPMPDPAYSVPSGPQCFDLHAFTFTSTGSTGPGTSHLWTFEDGLIPTSSAVNPSGITFTSSGWKTVTHQVTENGCVSIRVDSVLVWPVPIVDAGPDAFFCEGDSGAQLNGSVLFSNTTINWVEWWCDSVNVTTYCGLDSVNDLDPMATPNASTWYYLQVTDNNGCKSNIDSAWVTVLPKPIVDAGPDQYICPDSAPGVILSPNVTGAPGPFSYQWSPATGLNNDTIASPYARPATTTIYTLTVTSSNGCSSEATTVDSLSTVTVHVNPLPIADAGPDRHLCLGDSLMLQGFGYNAGPNYGFEWSPATGLSSTVIANPMAGPSATVEYILTVWSNGCPSYGDTVKVNVHTNPTASAGPQTDICLGESTQLDGSVSGDSTATFSFNWMPAASLDDPTSPTPIATPDTTTTYYLIGSSQYGCESPADSVKIVVKPTPVAEAGEMATICLGDSAQLNGSYMFTTTPPANPTEVYFAWTPNGGLLSDSTLTDPWVSPTQSQFYYLEVRHNTCSTLDSVLVTVIPELGVWAEADTGVICGGESVQLTSGGGIGNPNYNWVPATGLSDPHIANPVASPEVSTNYYLVLSEAGCVDTVEVAVNVIPTPDVEYISSVPIGCPDHTVSFVDQSADAIQWTWNFGDGTISNEQNPSHTYTTPGTYTVTLTGTNLGGCKASNSDIQITVVEAPQADFTTDPGLPVEVALPNTAVQFIDQSQHPISWIWEFGDGDQSDQQNPVHSYRDAGEYYITLTIENEQGCLSKVVHGPVIVHTPDLMIPNVFSPNADGINDGWTVDYTGSQPFSVVIFDRWGAQLFQTKDKMFAWDGVNEKGESVPEGVYFYTVQIGNKAYSGEVTLMR